MRQLDVPVFIPRKDMDLGLIARSALALGRKYKATMEFCMNGYGNSGSHCLTFDPNSQKPIESTNAEKRRKPFI